MPTIKELVYRIKPPEGKTVDQVVETVAASARDMVNNQWVEAIGIDIYDDHLMFYMQMRGHDQWWIRRRAPFIIVHLLIKSGLEVDDAELLELRRITNLKNARFWSEGRNKGKRVMAPPDGSEPPPKEHKPCRKCKQPAVMVEKKSGWHQNRKGKGY